MCFTKNNMRSGKEKLGNDQKTAQSERNSHSKNSRSEITKLTNRYVLILSITYNIFSKLKRKIIPSYKFLKFVYQVIIKFWFRKAIT